MPRWSLDRYRAEILAQTDLLRALVKDSDPTVRVPTCPEWNLGQLLRHVGGTHRWAETIVRTRATELVPDDLVNDVFGYGDKDPAVLDAWLADGARALDEALAEAGPDVRVWTVVPDQPLAFWARRMLFETVVHRADAAWTLGARYEVEAAVARDGLDEWMGFGTLPEVYDVAAAEPLLGAGRTLHFRATDQPADEWLVDLTGDAPTWQHTGGDAAVTVSGPLADLLLLVYGRPVDERVEVSGDTALLGLWLERTGFWLHE
ncbi:maleylpyruvate isomerase family mycothiol-dependent enzyme [Streptomyces litchfieldiae]|uniref:Maleylpyruvate isomerase family mycothiol-dependent enzyme n=1 Tax=Streptomyces litchfieldiae TaxID=3075543 RepID=A0ABU2MX41_9ACTN|nr:maleylpyruvate isomerase family mycothiol-dependent enzyme [Streptomyces sp. DSM 44938]MDT0345853.1 maleylpyruvate isomerase family mycothiol-dependent enzyme [Streptomyces sp. DSM 44938]